MKDVRNLTEPFAFDWAAVLLPHRRNSNLTGRLLRNSGARESRIVPIEGGVV